MIYGSSVGFGVHCSWNVSRKKYCDMPLPDTPGSQTFQNHVYVLNHRNLTTTTMVIDDCYY